MKCEECGRPATCRKWGGLRLWEGNICEQCMLDGGLDPDKEMPIREQFGPSLMFSSRINERKLKNWWDSECAKLPESAFIPKETP